MAKLDLGLPGYNSLFSTEKERSESNIERVETIPIDSITDFKNHPFHVELDEDMIKLIDSIQEHGILMPALVRPNPEGGYEMIAGHRRKYALEKLGLTEIKAIVRNLDDDQATILMVDSNVQREHILPSERAHAYKMRLDAMKHQGRSLLVDITSSQLGTKYKKERTDALLAEQVGVSRNQIQRYIRLTFLIEPFQEMVDGRHSEGYTMALNPAVEISFLKENEQQNLLNCIHEYDAMPSLVQAQKFKKASRNGTLSLDFMRGVLSMEKPNQMEKQTINITKYDKYFPKSYTYQQKEKKVEELLSDWAKKREKSKER